ncbi:MAG: hypothetical protein ACXW12_08890 [Burkholderiales bacterium]
MTMHGLVWAIALARSLYAVLQRLGCSTRRPAALAALALVGACASTPQAPLQADERAKEFAVHPSAATIYVYRSEWNTIDTGSVLYIDGRLIGATLPATYFRIDTVPGRHVLHGIGPDIGTIALDTRPGELYFVSVDVIGGHSHFSMVPPLPARDRIRDCCALLENWAPGQRPFLR